MSGRGRGRAGFTDGCKGYAHAWSPGGGSCRVTRRPTPPPPLTPLHPPFLPQVLFLSSHPSFPLRAPPTPPLRHTTVTQSCKRLRARARARPRCRRWSGRCRTGPSSSSPTASAQVPPAHVRIRVESQKAVVASPPPLRSGREVAIIAHRLRTLCVKTQRRRGGRLSAEPVYGSV